MYSVDQFLRSKYTIIHIMQDEIYAQEIRKRASREIPKSTSLDPVIDTDGLFGHYHYDWSDITINKPYIRDTDWFWTFTEGAILVCR